MKKFVVFMIIFGIFLTFCGCKTNNPYINRVSELRQDIYTGTFGNDTVTAYYGYCEYPFINDGKAGEPVYGYTFKLNAIADEIRRVAELVSDNGTLSAEFKYDDVTGEYKAKIETKTHFIKEFTIDLICGTETTKVKLTSVIPENCLNYENVLDKLAEKQKSLFAAYTVDGNFSAEIYMRVFVKNEKPFWYVGLASGNEKLKAFLIDGYSGDLLAVRDIF